MYFNVYSDTGGEIEGYLIPDGFSSKPSICIRAGSSLYGPFVCDIFLPGPYSHKHHDTGIVGFKINGDKIPDLPEISDLEISDADTGFVFYRRYLPHQHVPRRVFRLETQIAPHREFDNSLKSHFQFFAAGVEGFGSETVRQMLEIANQSSTYVSGRVLLKGVQPYITSETIKIVSLRDPFYELALRLSAVSALKYRALTFISERDLLFFRLAIDHFGGLDFSRPDQVCEKLRTAPKEILTLFESPFTHQLVASNPSEKVSRDSVAAALDALSQFAIFDPDEQSASLAFDTAEILALSPNALSFAPLRQQFVDMAAKLRNVAILEQVLESDLILHHFVRSASRKAKA